MKRVLIFALVLLLNSANSFAAVPGQGNLELGTYGGDGTSAPKLTLNEDKTFHYVDKTDSKNPIDISGTWFILDGEVILKDVKNKKVMDKLEITREGKCLKARKGTAFYTLCNCD